MCPCHKPDVPNQARVDDEPTSLSKSDFSTHMCTLWTVSASLPPYRPSTSFFLLTKMPYASLSLASASLSMFPAGTISVGM